MSNKTKVRLSLDEDRIQTVREQLQENGGYCPCRLQKNEDTKCPCKEFRLSIKEGKIGLCHCGLYEVVEEECVDGRSIQ